jgi:exopolysaccharide biosynthesis protein
MGLNRRKLVTLAIACAAIASPAIVGATTAHATVATPAFTPPPAAGLAEAATNVAVPKGFTLIPADSYTPLPVGASDLTETRSSADLAPGVTLTHIVRGTTPATTSTINTTLNGPFIVNEVTINPRKAKGHLTDARGQYMTSRNTVGTLVTDANGLVGVNTSFFDIGDNYGVPVGLALNNGQLIGDPAVTGTGTNGSNAVIVDSSTNKLILNGAYTWSGTVENLKTTQTLTLSSVDKNITVPSACSTLADQTQCTVAGPLIQYNPVWGAKTPTGYGVEVVLNKQGGIVSVNNTRGTALTAGETSLQATGSTAVALLSLVQGGGILKTSYKLYDNGRLVQLTPGDQAGTASGVEISNGANLNPYPGGVDTPNGRNPLTAVATTRDGDIILFTVEGRATFSVGLSYPEEAAALQNLGAWNGLNLDGGGSTQLYTGGEYVTTSSDGYSNSSSGTADNVGIQRADGDALVWVP